MREIVEFSTDEILPDREAVMRAMEVAPDHEPSEKIRELTEVSINTFQEISRPRAVMETITLGEFVTIYRGEGLNPLKTPLAKIIPQATRLALFAITVGEEVSGRIDALFNGNDYATGYALDAAASTGAENAADKVEARFGELLFRDDVLDSSTAHLRYSPGYCGWHISGQRKLFQRLEPGEIGIELNDSFLMQPLKSVSGVIVFGKKEIHLFKPTFPFCAECTTHTCRSRMKHVMKG